MSRAQILPFASGQENPLDPGPAAIWKRGFFYALRQKGRGWNPFPPPVRRGSIPSSPSCNSIL